MVSCNANVFTGHLLDAVDDTTMFIICMLADLVNEIAFCPSLRASAKNRILE